MIGEVAARNGVRLEADDPAFAVATLCELAFEDATRRLSEEISARLRQFEEAAQVLERRTGRYLAEEVKAAAEQIKKELGKETELGRLKTLELVSQVHRAHSRTAFLRWGAIGALTCAGALALGVWIGVYVLR